MGYLGNKGRCRRIFWLGDLNYRIDIAYERAHELVMTMDWHQLAEKNQDW
uniref:Inositol polyphosphate-related phosphatase domain-containing protein n=1 Tax=Oryza brachyantha TaxID=4533 RepID=J3LTR0_ORYBR